MAAKILTDTGSRARPGELLSRRRPGRRSGFELFAATGIIPRRAPRPQHAMPGTPRHGLVSGPVRRPGDVAILHSHRLVKAMASAKIVLPAIGALGRIAPLRAIRTVVACVHAASLRETGNADMR